VVAAAVANLSCCLLGGAVGVLFAPPRVKRRATAAAATLTSLLAIVAVSAPLGPAGGPVEVARRLSDANQRPLAGRELIASATCIVLASICFLVADRWARRAA
jgi:hypothetical protein